MEGHPEEVASTQKTLQASHDPGWNDPPSWALSASQKPTSGTPKGRLLNKRVAFPLNTPSPTTNSNLKTDFPPIGNIPAPIDIANLSTAPHKPVVAPTTVTNNSNLDITINKDEALRDSLENFAFVLQEVDPIKREEIKKRLDRMENSWREDKLNNRIHKKVLEISEALKASEYEKANDLHVSLMMSDSSLCSIWIPGIRQLTSELKNKTTVI